MLDHTGTRRRLHALSVIAALSLGGLLARGAHLQIARGDASSRELDAAKVERVAATPKRGSVVDARGRLLAETRRAPDGSSRSVRVYPAGELTANVVGYLNEVTPAELPDGYRPGDRIGRAGVERAFERDLRGTPGYTLRPFTRRVAVPEGRSGVAPIPGRDVALTIDLAMTRAISESFAHHTQDRGAAIVVDVHTGRVLALVSKPSFDPALLDEGLGVDPLGHGGEIDRGRMEALPPGSTFHPITAIAGAATPHADDPITCTGEVRTFEGRRYMCLRAHGHTDLTHAIADRCHAFFFRRVLSGLALDTIAGAAASFGFGEPSGLGLANEAPGFVPARAWYEARGQGGNVSGHAMNMAIGQGDVRVTPLQLAMAYAALANGGVLYKPVIAHLAGSAPIPEARRTITIPRDVLGSVREGLARAVKDPSNKAHPAAEAGVPVAGSVGYAELAKTKIAWFAGYAPAEAPAIAVVVLALDGPREAPSIAADVIKAYVHREELAP